MESYREWRRNRTRHRQTRKDPLTNHNRERARNIDKNRNTDTKPMKERQTYKGRDIRIEKHIERQTNSQMKTSHPYCRRRFRFDSFHFRCTDWDRSWRRRCPGESLLVSELTIRCSLRRFPTHGRRFSETRWL